MLYSYLDPSFGDGDGLLLHGLMDGYLIPRLHLVKLINAAHTLWTRTPHLY